jgi:hypothetical protein
LQVVLPQRRITRSFWIVTHKDTHNLARIREGSKWLVDTALRHKTIMIPA